LTRVYRESGVDLNRDAARILQRHFQSGIDADEHRPN
jgi:hypothetical protein